MWSQWFYTWDFSRVGISLFISPTLRSCVCRTHHEAGVLQWKHDDDDAPTAVVAAVVTKVPSFAIAETTSEKLAYFY